MEVFIEVLFQFAPFLILVVLGYLAGSYLESRHYRSIRAREAALLEQPKITFLKSTGDSDMIAQSYMVMGSAVISIDYFKRFLAGLINFFGGRITAYESLVDRARREALLRMQAQALDMDIIVNVRIETSSISKNTQKSVGSVEAFAYGTALKYR